MKMLRNFVMVAVLLGASTMPVEQLYACFYASSIGFNAWEDMTCDETCETQEIENLQEECNEACEQHCGTGWNGDLDAECTELDPGECEVGCGCTPPI